MHCYAWLIEVCNSSVNCLIREKLQFCDKIEGLIQAGGGSAKHVKKISNWWNEGTLYNGGVCVWCFEGSWTLYDRAKSSRENLIKSSRRKTGLKAHARAYTRDHLPIIRFALKGNSWFAPVAAFGKRIPQWSEKRYYAPRHKGSERSDLPSGEVGKLASAVYSPRLRDGHGIRDAISPRRVHPAEKKTSGKL